ncbi:ethanolaminephosphotransferase 1 isoform X2 [Carassius auratus]|uniref:Ethanolaminephosphotransferase 1 n=1 Tax=Carassius auratus TaxID=7957 RepID=A0A6P6J633_CARAU|nr:ethanolaminephosphotransferase 1-like isoform X2 [Carassius auratus]
MKEHSSGVVTPLRRRRSRAALRILYADTVVNFGPSQSSAAVIMALFHYVTQEQLSGFDKYKYSAVDSNPLSIYVMHPFWNSVVKILPTWLAPNLITFTGFMFLVLTFTLLSFFDFDFYASGKGHTHVPSWVWIAAGLFNFLAYTLDGVDGKQARRTNSSTPLGELFDHGLDSWACVFFVATVYSVFGRGESGVSVVTLYYLLWVVLFSFILSHWEKYNTGILFLPWGYDISQVTISVVYIVTAVVGVETWYKPVIGNVHYRNLFTVLIVGCLFVVTLPMSLYNVFKAYRNNTLKHSSVYEALLPFFSPVLLFVLSTLWISLSPTDIIEKQPRIFYLMVGTAFSNVTCKLIVCQMSNTRCKPLSLLLLPMTAVVLLVITGTLQDGEITVLYIWTAIVLLTHIHYGVSVVKQLSDHFNIYAFSLKKPNSD